MSSIKTIINLVDQISPVNFGIWHAAIATAGSLNKQFGIESWLIAPYSEQDVDPVQFPDLKVRSIPGTHLKDARFLFSDFDKNSTLVVSHGSWQYPTRWGSFAKKSGFVWIYTPHGMLEPWSMNQKWLKKQIYFQLIEKKLAANASLIRAVGRPEYDNLKTIFPKVVHIPNGIYDFDILPLNKPETPIRFLYLARLHHKKGIIPLLNAWLTSEPGKSNKHELVIAGTDDGEQKKIEALISTFQPNNVRFVGPRFGKDKTDLILQSHFYVLPSKSEGFPTSVVEAMGGGLIPIITEGCNFPEAFENNLAIKTSPIEMDILNALNLAFSLSLAEIHTRSINAQTFVKAQYAWSEIASHQKTVFEKLLPNQYLK